jgi:hypothetical protein
MDGTSLVILPIALIALGVAMLIYFLPTLFASGKQHWAGVFVVNLFLGWTLIGWVCALAWAVSSPLKEKS